MKTSRRLFCVVLALIMVALSAITLTTASADVIVGDFRLSDDQQILVARAVIRFLQTPL